MKAYGAPSGGDQMALMAQHGMGRIIMAAREIMCWPRRHGVMAYRRSDGISSMF